MKTILVQYLDPTNTRSILYDDLEEKDYCFMAYRYVYADIALKAYRRSSAMYKTLLDDSMTNEEVKEWINVAYNHIKDRDYDWLEENFI